MFFVYLFVILFFFCNHDIGSQISPLLEITNFHQSMGHKMWVLPFQSIFFLIRMSYETNPWPHV